MDPKSNTNFVGQNVVKITSSKDDRMSSILDISEKIMNNVYFNNLEEKSIENIIAESLTVNNMMNLLKDLISTKLEKLHLKDQTFSNINTKIAHSLVRNFILTQKLIDFDNLNTIINNINNIYPYDLLNKNIDKKDINDIINLFNNILLCYTKDPLVIKSSNIIISREQYYINLKYGTSCYDIHIKVFNRLKSVYTQLNFDKNITDIQENSNYQKLFNERLLKMLIKNKSIQLHTGLSFKYFELIKKHLDVNFELFSSPINNYLSNYTSAYPDVDKYFGSRGNFFEVYPNLFYRGGSYQAFPPRIEEYIGVFSIIILDQLKNNNNPLSFFVVIPTWPDSQACDLLLNSEYVIHKVINKKQIAHNGECSNQNLSFIILQNESGKDKYKVSKELIDELNQ